MARKTKQTLRDRFDAYAQEYPSRVTLLVFLSVFVALVGIFFFVTFTDFGGSAEFIYNQF